MATEPALSPLIQGFIDKGLLDRLPATFSTYFLEQFQGWHLLFPAERSYHERLFGLLDRSDTEAVDALFAPLRQLESQMGINGKTWSRRSFSIDQIEYLQRSP